jgi:hypothetical protein
VPEPTRADIVKIQRLRWASLALALGLSTYWSWTFSGFYWLLARIQFAVIGAYISGLTWLVVFTVVAIPLHLLARAIAHLAGLTQFDEVELSLWLPPIPGWLGKFVERHMLSLFGLLWIMGGVVADGYFLLDGALAGPLTQQSVETLYRGEQPKSRYVDLTGRPLRSDDYLVGSTGSTLSRSGAGSDYYYFPMVPATWRAGDPVRVIVCSFYAQANDVNDTKDHPNRLRGILRRRVPPLALEALRQTAVVADDAWLLDETASPANDRQIGLTMMAGFTTFGILMIGFVHALVWYGDRKLQRKQP